MNAEQKAWRLEPEHESGYRKAIHHLVVCLEDGMDIYQALDLMEGEHGELKHRMGRMRAAVSDDLLGEVS